MRTAVLPSEALGVLGEGRQAYVAVGSSRGPHVTPELYAWSDGAIWFAAAASTVKARVLRRDPRAGVVVSVPGRAVVLTGEVRALDPFRPLDLARQLGHLPASGRAITRYTTRNASDLLAFSGDLVSGKLGWRPPPRRVLFSLRPDRVVVVENDSVTGHHGWDSAPVDAETDGEAVPVGGVRAVAGLPGPIALPGRWFPDRSQLHVAAQLTELLDLPTSFPVSVVVDDYAAPGPAAKRGTLVRGVGCFDRRDASVLRVDTERVTEWDGVETTTTAVR